MATKKKTQPTPAPSATPPAAANREQRRRAKFGRAGGETKGPWPQSEVNPAFGGTAQDSAAHTGTPEQDVAPTSSGAGGATKGDDRVVEREGIHGSNTAKG